MDRPWLAVILGGVATHGDLPSRVRTGPPTGVLPYLVTVFGSTSVRERSDTRRHDRLSDAKRELLTHLVVAGKRGLEAGDLPPVDDDQPVENSALRMAVARLRKHLPDDALPKPVAGRYFLRLSIDAVDLWHLRSLAAGGELDGLSSVQLGHLLMPRFPPIDAIDERGDEVPRLQLALIARLAREVPAALDVELLDALEAHVAESPFNEQLLAIGAACVARSGDRRAAINLISSGIKGLLEVGLEPSPSLRALEASLLDGDEVVPQINTESLRRPAVLPNQLSVLRSSAIIGRDSLLDELWSDHLTTPTGVLVVQGPRGSGRTRICAEHAHRVVQRGGTVLYGVAQEIGESAFGPIVASLPGLQDRISELFFDELDLEDRRASTWATVSRSLMERLGPKGLLVLDDCQWIDSRTAEYLSHIARTAGSLWRVLVSAADQPHSNTPWHTLRRSLEDFGNPVHSVAPLSVSDMRDLALSARSELSGRQAWGLGTELQHLTEGRPALALGLLASPDVPGGGLSVLSSSVGAAFDHLVADLPVTVRLVGAAMSLIGRPTTVEFITLVTGVDRPEVLGALDRLVRLGFARELSVEGFAATDVETRAAFERSILDLQLRELHFRLADLLPGLPHARAHHLAAAVPFAEAADAAQALRASGEAHCREGNHREAVLAYRRAFEIDAEPLLANDAWAFSRALDLAGEPDAARQLRADAVERSIGARQFDDAFLVATSGLPEAEPLDGDASLCELLDALPANKLQPEVRWSLLYQRSRQNAILGRLEEAEEGSRLTARTATSDSQRFSAAVLRRWAVAARSGPPERIALIEETTELQLGAAERAERHVLLAVDHYEYGDTQRVRRELDLLRDLGEALSPVRQWHAALFAAMLATDDGQLVEGARLRAEAHRLGLSYGLVEADAAAFGAEFVLGRLLGGTHSASAGRVRAAPTPAAVTTSVLSHAAAALVLSDLGRSAEAIAAAESLARSVLHSPMSGGVAATALVCPVLASSSDDALVSQIENLLRRRGDSMMLVGAGAVSLGPTARYLSQLSSSPADRLRHLRDAVAVADRSGSRLWQVVTRCDALSQDFQRYALAEVREIAVGTELAPVVGSVGGGEEAAI